ncbi:MAG: hypothetical protein E6G56_08190 [Actinobacteria bacterium]|nr:MAG: hypothetical protein E6G56_08190 [Actinomycetota bacterium]
MTVAEFVELLLVRRRGLFLAVLLGAFAAAAALTFALPKRYEATATLFVGENRPVATGANSVPLDEVLAQTYDELLGTPAIQRQVAGSLHMPPARISGQVSFQVVEGTHLIRITATDASPSQAAAIANAYAKTFVGDRQGSAAGGDRARLAALRSQMNALALEIARLQGTRQHGRQARLLTDQSQLSIDRDTVSTITQNDTLQGTNVAVASPAVVPASPAKPKPALYLALGAVFALLLAIGATLAANALDSRIREPEELAALFGAPVLAQIPRARVGQATDDGPLMLQGPVEFLRMNLRQLSDPDRPLRMIAFTSARSAEGKTAVVAAFARAVARVRAPIVAVDADVRQPRLASAFGLSSGTGLTSVLADSLDPLELLARDESGVAVLPSGPPVPDPAPYFTRVRLARVLDRLRASSSYVAIDTAPVLGAPETSSLGEMVDGVVMVIDVDQAKRRTLLVARDQLANTGAKLIGLVLNRVPPHTGAYDYSYYYRRPPVNGDGAFGGMAPAAVHSGNGRVAPTAPSRERDAAR